MTHPSGVNQVVEYMVITRHFTDARWNLQKRVLSFVKVPTPRRGIDVADAIFKCLKTWGIEKKFFQYLWIMPLTMTHA